MKTPSKRPQDRSAADKLKAVIQYENLPDEKRGEFLRREGLHAENVATWRKQIEVSLEPRKMTKAERAERAEDQRKIKELERQLRRKDKALAETAALLVLKKKAELLWGTEDSE